MSTTSFLGHLPLLKNGAYKYICLIFIRIGINYIRKKMNRFLLLCFLSVSYMLLQGCGNPTADKPAIEVEPATIKEPSIIISLDEAEELFENYGKFRVPLIEKFQNVDDEGNALDPNSETFVQATRSLSIDYKTLKDYLAFIEQETARTKTNITGLRIYFGLYGPKGLNPNAETVFLNPLMEYGKKGNIRDDVSFAIQEIGGNPAAVAVGKILGSFNEYDKPQGTNLEMTVQGPVQSLAGDNLPWRPPPPPPNDPDY